MADKAVPARDRVGADPKFLAESTAAEFKLMALLVRELDGHEAVSLTVAELAARAGFSPPTVRTALAGLVDSWGLVVRTGGKRVGYEYRLPGQKPAPKKGDLWFAGVAEVCGLDTKTLSRSMRGRVAKAKASLKKAGYSPEDISKMGMEWRSQSWLGSTNPEPSPEQLVDWASKMEFKLKKGKADKKEAGTRQDYQAFMASALANGKAVAELPAYEEWRKV